NAWASGALVKDTLFFYGLLSYNKEERDAWGAETSDRNTHTTTKSPTWLLKLDWNINDSNLLEFTAFSDKSKDYIDIYNNTLGEIDRTTYLGQTVNENGGDNYILKYTGYLTDTFTLSALYGHSKFSRGTYLVTPDGDKVFYDGEISAPTQQGCPLVIDGRPKSRQEITGIYSITCNISGGTMDRIDSGDTS